MTTVGDELLNEIERVSAKRERWKSYAKDLGTDGRGLEISIIVMTLAIDKAKEALKSDNPSLAICALEVLRGYDEND